MLIKEYQGYFEKEIIVKHDTKKDSKNDEEKDGKKRVRGRRQKVQKQDSV